jgi:hypothetical protein
MLTPDAKRSCHSNRYKKNEARVPTVVFIASPWVEAIAGGRRFGSCAMKDQFATKSNTPFGSSATRHKGDIQNLSAR